MAEPVLRMIPINQITPNPFQPRESFPKEGLEELGESIKEAGLVQPILVRRMGNVFQIIAGERRWRAYQLAGLKTIPSIIREADDYETREISLIENWHRLALQPLEAERFIARLYEDGIKSGRYQSVSDMSRKTGVPYATLQTMISAYRERDKQKLPSMATYQDIERTTPLREKPELRKQVLQLREEGEIPADRLREVSRIVAKAPELVAKAILKPRSRITPRVAEKILELPKEKQEKAIQQIEGFRLEEEEAMFHLEAMKVEIPSPSPEQIEAIREQIREGEERLKAILERPEVKERGKLFENWVAHGALLKVLGSARCPICGASWDNLEWGCHKLNVKEAYDLLTDQYQRSIKKE